MKTPAHSLLLPLLFSLALSACGATSPAMQTREDAEQEDAALCEDPRADRCVVLACAGEAGLCGIFSCEDVDPEFAAQAHVAPGVELAWARPPSSGPGPFRHWRRTGLRQGAEPRVTFHFRYRQGFLPAFPRYTGKVVKHHLFPQAKAFRAWFKKAGVDIHEYTMVIPEHVHLQIHGRDGRGGLWNQAWRDYIDANPRPPPPDVVLRHAFGLAFRFRLTGPLVPYSHPVVPIGPQLFSR